MTPIKIFEDLKEKIIWLEIKPGTTLNLVELAEQYHVSRNPVTIALTRLETEDWVIRNGSHFVVSSLTLERMREITEIRMVMETQATIWAMHRISEESLEKLRVLAGKISKLVDNIDKREIIKLDVEFHRLIFWGSKNNQLAVMLDRLQKHYLRFWLSSPSIIKPTIFFKEILDIIKAIETKDEVQLKAACISHIKASLDEIMGI